jgi:hypothetical protein
MVFGWQNISLPVAAAEPALSRHAASVESSTSRCSAGRPRTGPRTERATRFITSGALTAATASGEVVEPRHRGVEPVRK